LSTYTDVSSIGSGGFGEVWRCESVLDGTNYAKKILQDGMDNDGIKRFQREVRILERV
jgi:eukaryotic-like serine/threonine-protein kinase